MRMCSCLEVGMRRRVASCTYSDPIIFARSYRPSSESNPAIQHRRSWREKQQQITNAASGDILATTFISEPKNTWAKKRDSHIVLWNPIDILVTRLPKWVFWPRESYIFHLNMASSKCTWTVYAREYLDVSCPSQLKDWLWMRCGMWSGPTFELSGVALDEWKASRRGQYCRWGSSWKIEQSNLFYEQRGSSTTATRGRSEVGQRSRRKYHSLCRFFAGLSRHLASPQ